LFNGNPLDIGSGGFPDNLTARYGLAGGIRSALQSDKCLLVLQLSFSQGIRFRIHFPENMVIGRTVRHIIKKDIVV
jgi:hypothetical protein